VARKVAAKKRTARKKPLPGVPESVTLNNVETTPYGDVVLSLSNGLKVTVRNGEPARSINKSLVMGAVCGMGSVDGVDATGRLFEFKTDPMWAWRRQIDAYQYMMGAGAHLRLDTRRHDLLDLSVRISKLEAAAAKKQPACDPPVVTSCNPRYDGAVQWAKPGVKVHHRSVYNYDNGVVVERPNGATIAGQHGCLVYVAWPDGVVRAHYEHNLQPVCGC